MTNRPKQIGTWTETALVNWCRANGFAGADRLPLKGRLDEGDVSLCPGVIAEVKGGHAAEHASDQQVLDWLAEAEVERFNSDADVAFLCWKRKGKGAASAGQWWAAFNGHTYTRLVCAHIDGLDDIVDRAFARAYMAGHALPPVRFTLTDALLLLRGAGYGDPLPRKDTP